MAKVRVEVQGYGSFQIEAEMVSQLLSFLSSNQAVDVTPDNVVREVQNNSFTGRSLLNG